MSQSYLYKRHNTRPLCETSHETKSAHDELEVQQYDTNSKVSLTTSQAIFVSDKIKSLTTGIIYHIALEPFW